ncbi:hypothetical protein BJF90_08335 [Pseudonocardia sp. CNS-004]|nr:hypothetical protein BJF90_08335 [Pseudonocardia sp. CNS-004]
MMLMLSAPASRCAGKTSEITAVAPVMMIAAATPCTPRSAASRAGPPANAAPTLDTTRTASPAR